MVVLAIQNTLPQNNPAGIIGRSLLVSDYKTEPFLNVSTVQSKSSYNWNSEFTQEMWQ